MATNAKGGGIRRGEMAFLIAIVIGVALGAMVRRVRLGLLLGLIVGSLIVFLGWISIKRRD